MSRLQYAAGISGPPSRLAMLPVNVAFVRTRSTGRTLRVPRRGPWCGSSRGGGLGAGSPSTSHGFSMEHR